MTARARKRLVLGLLLLVGLVIGLVNTHKKEVSELVVYVLGAERMSEGAEIYRADDAKPFTYPPSFAMPFMPFLAVPEKAQRTVWFFVNVAAFAGVVALLRDLLMRFLRERGDAERATRWLWIATFVLAGRHVAAVFENQSHDMLVFLFVTLAAWCGARKRDGLAGAAAGLGASFKATPLLFAPVFFGERRWRAGAMVLITTGLMVWLPDLVYPRSDGGSWVVAWYDTFLSGIGAGETAKADGAWAAWNFLNQNLAGSLYRLATPVAEAQEHGALWDVSIIAPSAAGLKAITLGGQAAVLAYLGWCARPALTRGESSGSTAFRRVGEAGLVGCGMVLLSPMSSKAHFCVLTLAMLFCVTHYARVKRDPVQLGLLVLVFITGTLTVKGLVGSSIGNELLARGSVCWHTVILMFATGRALRVGFGDPTKGSGETSAAAEPA